MTTQPDYQADVIKYKGPYGESVHTSTPLPFGTYDYYQDMLSADCYFEAEILRTGEVSITITNNEMDVDIEITPNGPEVQEGMVTMLKRQRWRE